MSRGAGCLGPDEDPNGRSGRQGSGVEPISEIFGDQTVAAAMIDRILHHADVHTLKGNSYRLKHTTHDTLPSVHLSDQTN